MNFEKCLKHLKQIQKFVLKQIQRSICMSCCNIKLKLSIFCAL